MWVLVLIMIVVILGVLLIRYMDQHRWQRYQFERDLYFRQYPLLLQCGEQFSMTLQLNKVMQKKLINELMLKPQEQCFVKKALIQRAEDVGGQKYTVKVSIHDKIFAYLDVAYANALGEQLHSTDFEIGRPIEVLAEIMVFYTDNVNTARQERGCRLRLDLPHDPDRVLHYLVMDSKKATSA